MLFTSYAFWPLHGAYLLMQDDYTCFLVCCLVQMLVPMGINDSTTTEELEFTGSITTARCSVPRDRQRIIKEIEDAANEVNDAVANLKNYGMWTRNLAIVYAQQAAVMTHTQEKVRLIGFYVVWILFAYSEPPFLSDSTQWIMQACPVVWFLSRSLSLPDEKLFATSTMANALSALIIMLTILFISDEWSTLTWNPRYVFGQILPGASLLICALSLVGLGRVIHIPYIGPRCARTLLNSNPYINCIMHFVKTCDCRRRPGQERMGCRTRLFRLVWHVAEIACFAVIWSVIMNALSTQPDCAARLIVDGTEAADHHCILGNYTKTDLLPEKNIRRRPVYENERSDCTYKMFIYFQDALWSPGGGTWNAGFRDSSRRWFWSAQAQSAALCPEVASNWFSASDGPIGVKARISGTSAFSHDATASSSILMA